jgi:hypothetical protein
LENEVENSQIIAINFENIDFEHLSTYRLLYDYIVEKLIPNKMNYIFLDEIQHVEQFEKAVDSLFLKENCDVYITGSNAYFMSGELATLLSGRYVELKMLPLSFKEFYNSLNDNVKSNSLDSIFNLYIENGSFPYTAKLDYSIRESKEYLKDIYNSVILKDVVTRLKISDITNLENITKFLLHNIGNKVSTSKIVNYLKSNGKSIDQKTVDKYIKGLTDSLLLYESKRYNLKGKQFLATQSKYYCVDIGLRNMLVRGKDSDVGHILENIVYLELLRRGYNVYVGQYDEREVDFVAINGDEIQYYQVAATTLEEKTLKRELSVFRKIQDNYPKYLLTLDEVFGTANYEGIQKINVLNWLLD